MSWRLLIAVLIAVVAIQGAETNTRSKLYVVSAFFSDNGPAFYYRVLDLRAEGQNSRVRYSRIATVNLYCPRMIVQNVEAKLPHSPSKLLRSSNPCTVKPGELDAAVKKYKRSDGAFEAISFGLGRAMWQFRSYPPLANLAERGFRPLAARQSGDGQALGFSFRDRRLSVRDKEPALRFLEIRPARWAIAVASMLENSVS
jgi:hypothetical protein